MIISVLAIWMVGTVSADTLYLRDGTEVKGTFISFEEGQFTFETPDGSQAKYLTRRVEKLVIDREGRRSDVRSRRNPRRGASETAGAGSVRWETITPFDVRLEDQWIRSEIELAKGQRVRVNASGTVMLEGRTSTGPDGLSNRRDSDAPMPNSNDGALIAVIGKDANAPAFLIGSQKEFVADRDGMLYFTVNHWETRNTSGAFRVNVSLERGTRDWTENSTGQTQKQSKVVIVQGDRNWTDTGIDIDSKDIVEIAAEGLVTISTDRRTTPNGERNFNTSNSVYPVQSAGVGALIAKIRFRSGTDSRLRFVGSSSQMIIGSNESGRLFLGINDDYLLDNSGSYRVTIRW